MQTSVADSVLDIRQFLSEAHQTCFYTCYDLKLDGEPVLLLPSASFYGSAADRPSFLTAIRVGTAERLH